MNAILVLSAFSLNTEMRMALYRVAIGFISYFNLKQLMFARLFNQCGRIIFILVIRIIGKK